MDAYFDGLVLPRWLFHRGLAVLYLVAFVSARNQFRPLLGERGLLPVPRLLERVSWLKAPSIFFVHYSDRAFGAVAWLGIVLSTVALVGLSDAGGWWSTFAVWIVLWVLYLSIVNVGQTFYAFGWESMLVEAGFFAAFLGPSHVAPSVIGILLLRWMLFRVELGAGLIKLRHDSCWRDRTCLYFHHETQPLPNPLSWYAHRLPKPVHRMGVVVSHVVQIGAPFLLFAPQPLASIAGLLVIGHQLLLIVSGNYAWLNWLTIVLAFSAFSDVTLAWVPVAMPLVMDPTDLQASVLWLVAGATLALSVQPTINFFLKAQKMNASYNPLRLVNAYGAFGSVTRKRYEIVIEGTRDESDGPDTAWEAYEFRAKPGDPKRRPPQVAPYHLRLDWLMWFLPLRAMIDDTGVYVPGYEPWFLAFVRKLLEGDPSIRRLLRRDPFGDRPPARIRARAVWYRFTDREEREATGAWWTCTPMGDFLPPVAREDLATLD